MQDLSAMAADSMWATSQHAGNRPSDMSVAMTATGSPSPSVDETAGGVAGTDDVAGQPFVVPAAHARTVLHPGGEPAGASVWRQADGTPWRDAQPDISGGNAPSTDWPQS